MPLPEGEAWKTGGYGTTIWHQQLDCGHVMSKKRKLKPGVEVDCPECRELEEQRRSFERMPDPEVTDTSRHEYIEATVLGPRPRLGVSCSRTGRFLEGRHRSRPRCHG